MSKRKFLCGESYIDERRFFWYTNRNIVPFWAQTIWEEFIMADNKQYITQVQENGSVLISEDVIISIVDHAVSEVKGVIGVHSKPAAELADMIGKKWGKGIRVSVDDDNTVVIDVNVIIGYGQSVIAIAKAVQSAVINAVQAVTTVEDVIVNVNVSGIVRQ